MCFTSFRFRLYLLLYLLPFPHFLSFPFCVIFSLFSCESVCFCCFACLFSFFFLTRDSFNLYLFIYFYFLLTIQYSSLSSLLLYFLHFSHNFYYVRTGLSRPSFSPYFFLFLLLNLLLTSPFSHISILALPNPFFYLHPPSFCYRLSLFFFHSSPYPLFANLASLFSSLPLFRFLSPLSLTLTTLVPRLPSL